MGGRGAKTFGNAKISQALETIRNAKKENLLVFNADGEITYTEKGDKRHVGSGEEDYKGKIVAHNHPEGVMPYPSEKDFETMEKTGMQEMIVVSKDYTIRYSIDKNYKGYGRGGIAYTINRNKADLYDMRKKINDKAIADYKNGKYKTKQEYKDDTNRKQTEAILKEYKRYSKNSGYKLTITKNKK